MKTLGAHMIGCSMCLECMQIHHEVLKRKKNITWAKNWLTTEALEYKHRWPQVRSTRYFLTAMSSRPWLQQPTHQSQTLLLAFNNSVNGIHVLIFNCFVCLFYHSFWVLNDSSSKLSACAMRRDNEWNNRKTSEVYGGWELNYLKMV